MDALIEYCRRSAELAWAVHERFREKEARLRVLRAKVRRVTRRWGEDEILPLGLHDWRPPLKGGSGGSSTGNGSPGGL